MKTTTILSVVAATLPVAQSIQLNHAREAAPRVVGFPLERKHAANPVQSSHERMRKRQTITESLDNEQSFYFATIGLGTPAQNIKFALDTGSSDVWTNAANSTLCTKHGGKACQQAGSFNVKKSKSVKYVDNTFNISYADGTGATGDYLTDVLAIGGKTIQNFQFAVGYESSNEQGVMGIGYQGNEASISNNENKPYNNMPLAMAQAKLISSPAYSLWLDDFESSTGQILFGGVNTNKYHGQLQSVPIMPVDGSFAYFLIALTDIGFSNSSDGTSTSIQSSSSSDGTSSSTDSGSSFDGSSTSTQSGSTFPAGVILDSGSTLSYLPQDMASALFQAIGAQYDEEQQVAIADCNLINSGAFVNFTFSSPSISVPISELFLGGGPDDQYQLGDGTVGCALGIGPTEGGVGVLGDTFLRSAYAVFDLANNEISLAQTNFNSTTDSIVEIGTGTNAVPSATRVANAVSSVAVASGDAVLGGAPTAIASAVSTPGGAGDASVTSTDAAPRPTGQALLGALVAGAALVAAAL